MRASLSFKEAGVRFLQDQLGGADFIAVAGFEGMNVKEIEEVKKNLRVAHGEFKVVKNSLAIRAAEAVQMAPLATCFVGQVGLVLGKGDPVVPARILKRITETQKKFQVKGGVLHRQVVSRADVLRVADFPLRPELYAQLVGTLKSPLYNMTCMLHGVIGQWVRLLSAVCTKRSAVEAEPAHVQ